jgi:dephospho-CoA kinase
MAPGRRPRRIALTGGIASGKSYCLARMASLGVPTVDADLIAREVTAPGRPALLAIVRRFGSRMVGEGGRLDRAALARLVFDDAAARRDLETIVHPEVYAAIERWFAALESASPPPAVAVADIPLVFETNRASAFDAVVVAACPRALQLERLIARSALTRAEAEARLASQMPIEEKAARATHVIDTSGTFDATDRQVEAVVDLLRHAP